MSSTAPHRMPHAAARPDRLRTPRSELTERPVIAGRRRACAAAIAALLLGAGTAAAQAPDEDAIDWLDTVKGFKPYASLGYSWDSNLLRNPEQLDPKSDQYLTLEAGFDSRIDKSRQRFVFSGRVFRNDYQRFSEFNYTGGDARALWRWAAGRRWEGTLGYTYTRRLRDFANELEATRDIRNRNRVFGSANRWLSTRWRIGAGAEWSDISFSDTSALNKNRLALSTNLDFVSTTENIIGLKIDYADTSFDNNSRLDYEDWAVGPAFDWQLTTKTRLRGSAGYQTRIYDELSGRDFDGPVGRLRATWQATGKTSIDTNLWRELSTLEDEIATYAIVTGISVAPTWNITGKTSVNAFAAYETRDFEGSQGDVVDPQFDDRVDDVTSFGLWLRWQARPNISLSLGYETQDRDSDRELRDYNYDLIQARFNLGL